jgi:hypothetical protein
MVSTDDGLVPVDQLGKERPKADQTADEERKMDKPDPKPAPKPTSKAEPKKPTQKKGGKPASEEAVLVRAKRMYRGKLRQVWEALGKDGPLDEEALDGELKRLVEERESQMGDRERQESRLAKIEEQNAELRTKLASAQAAAEKAEKARATEQQRREHVEIEHEIRDVARDAGVRDGDYALHLFRSHVKGLGDDQDVDPRQFFESLKKDDSKRHLFREEPVKAGPSTLEKDQQQQATPPGQPNQPQPQPKPAVAGAQSNGPDDALALDKRSFNQRTADKYGFRPGMA